MSTFSDNFDKIKTEYETKRANAIKDAEARTLTLHAQYPALKAIDGKLRATGINILGEAMKGKNGLEERLKALEEENLELQKQRKDLIEALGLPSDCTDPHYECKECSDTGYIGINMCRCFKAALAKCTFENSGLGSLLKDQAFDTFDLSYYNDNPANHERMKKNLEKCRIYADTFAEGSPNLILIGATGLGKTHLSTSIAKKVIEKGYRVVYDSSPNVFNDFNKEQFKNESGLTDKYFECDLLILDDLGTEMITSFTVFSLYNLINTRLNTGKCTIINTNLSIDELRKAYTDRITSRIFGCFEPLMFTGKDVRMQKLQKNL